MYRKRTIIKISSILAISLFLLCISAFNPASSKTMAAEVEMSAPTSSALSVSKAFGASASSIYTNNPKGIASGVSFSNASTSSESTAKDSSNNNTSGTKDSKSTGFRSFKEAVFDKSKAEGNDEAQIDVSSASKGYFGIYSDSDKRLKLQILKDDAEAYIYDLVAKKTDFFPFQSGDGKYTIRVMKNVEDSKYFELYSVDVQVKLENEFAPYLMPCQYADYTKTSKCVKEAEAFARNARDEKDFIYTIYEYVCANVKYDREKAKTVQSGYIPKPDDTFTTRKGICFDYASLAASMLRSQGIPTKIIFGYVAPKDIYHAWNMFYTEETGWTTVEFKVDPKKWNRIDLTFLANGADGSFIGDGSNYTDVYQY